MGSNVTWTQFAAAICMLLALVLIISPTVVFRPILPGHVVSREASSTTPRCPYPLVYNKPHKTASTYIQSLITNWTAQTNRNNYICAGQTLESAIYFPECIPHKPDECGVVNCHLLLSRQTQSILNVRMPGHRIITSTRYPPHRILSNFMQINRFRGESSDKMYDDVRRYLTRSFNPWTLYNFHTGEKRLGSCPIKVLDKTDIYQMVMKYDLVIDANLVEESNIILKHHGLFTFPDKASKVNFRGASSLQVPEDIKQLLHNVSCVERELHKALQMRMASLLEKITGKNCVKHGRTHTMTSCIADREKEILGDTWMF